MSAFASLSLTPPMVLVALDRGSDLLALVRTSGRFGVNVLGSTQSALALTFAYPVLKHDWAEERRIEEKLRKLKRWVV